MSNNSKPLGHDDESGFGFVKELLQGDSTFAINFDRLQKHPQLGYIIRDCVRVQDGDSGAKSAE
jgi:hypothetical protein